MNPARNNVPNRDVCGTNKNLVLTFRGSSQPRTISAKPTSTMLIGQEILAIGTEYIEIYYLPWMLSAYPNIRRASLFFEAVIRGAYLEIQLVNQTSGSVVESMTLTGSGFHEMPFRTPTTDSRLVLRVRKTSNASDPSIYGIGLLA